MMDWLPEDDIVHLINAVGVIEDLQRFESYSTAGPGQAAFSPAMMLAVLIYAYSNKLRSSRKIERLMPARCRVPAHRR